MDLKALFVLSVVFIIANNRRAFAENENKTPSPPCRLDFTSSSSPSLWRQVDLKNDSKIVFDLALESLNGYLRGLSKNGGVLCSDAKASSIQLQDACISSNNSSYAARFSYNVPCTIQDDSNAPDIVNLTGEVQGILGGSSGAPASSSAAAISLQAHAPSRDLSQPKQQQQPIDPANATRSLLMAV